MSQIHTPRISVIIPTLNEEECIFSLISYLGFCGGDILERIVVVDGGSKDKTIEEAKRAGVTVLKTQPGRAKQMNAGVKELFERGIDQTILRFVHADVRPPVSCFEDIKRSYTNGHLAGCFMTRYDTQNKELLATTTKRTKYDHRLFRMGGQTLWIHSDGFSLLRGYDESMIVCEEIDLFRKIYKHPEIPFENIKKEILVSARKHEINGHRRTNFIYLCIYVMYWLGCSQSQMIRFYTKNIRSERLAEADDYF